MNAADISLAAFARPVERSTLSIKLDLLAAWLDDPGINEIVINRPGSLDVERQGGLWESHLVPDLSYEWCEDFASSLASYSRQSIGEAWPLLGATLPGGQRVQIVMPPAVEAGTMSITIRRPGAAPLSLADLAAGGTFITTRPVQSGMPVGERARLEAALPPREQDLLRLFRAGQWAPFLQAAVLTRQNIVSSGAVSSGKTVLGNALGALIPLHERIITIEDAREMRLPHANQTNLLYAKDGNGVSKATPRALLEACLRMRPDRVLLAELRGSETYYFIQNVLNTGNPGTITTVHATSAMLAFPRLGMMISGSPEGAGLAMPAILARLYELVNVVVQMERTPDGRRIASEVYYDPAHAARAAIAGDHHAVP